MKTYVFWIILVVVGITSYNIFLIQRDQKMFDAYYNVCTSGKQRIC